MLIRTIDAFVVTDNKLLFNSTLLELYGHSHAALTKPSAEEKPDFPAVEFATEQVDRMRRIKQGVCSLLAEVQNHNFPGEHSEDTFQPPFIRHVYAVFGPTGCFIQLTHQLSPADNPLNIEISLADHLYN